MRASFGDAFLGVARPEPLAWSLVAPQSEDLRLFRCAAAMWRHQRLAAFGTLACNSKIRPHMGLDQVPAHTDPPPVESTQAKLSRRVSLFCRFSIPTRRFDEIPGTSIPSRIYRTEPSLCL